MHPAWLLLFFQHSGGSEATAECSFAHADGWLGHCASADDCTSDVGFCGCCVRHPSSSYAEACAAICPVLHNRFHFNDFSSTASEDELGPYFSPPADLSLVGDAAVVIGECANVDVRVSNLLEGGQDACLLPPIPERLLSPLDIDMCPNHVAPFQMETAAEIANLLCYEECSAEEGEARVVLPVVDEDALDLANCTRQCFTQHTDPRVEGCASECAPSDYACFANCHADEICTVPLGRRDTSVFASDPNVPVCETLLPRFQTRVAECNQKCREELSAVEVDPEKLVSEYYTAQCVPALSRGMEATSECLVNCTHACIDRCPSVEDYTEAGTGASNDDCGDACAAGCILNCTSAERRLETLSSACDALPPYSCRARSIELSCTRHARFCGWYDDGDRLRALNEPCDDTTGVVSVAFGIVSDARGVVGVSEGSAVTGNVSGTFIAEDLEWREWLNSSLDNASSALSLRLGVNATRHECVRSCETRRRRELLRPGPSSLELFMSQGLLSEGLLTGPTVVRCETVCFDRECTQGIEESCALELMRPPCELEPVVHLPDRWRGRELRDSWTCTEHANCSCEAAWSSLDEELRLRAPNRSEFAVAHPSVFFPQWDTHVCDQIVQDTYDEYVSCAECVQCVASCDYPPTFDGSPSLRIGYCLRSCRASCLATCTAELAARVHDPVEGPCEPPAGPQCEPPPECMRDCSDSCLDASHLAARAGCDLNLGRIREAMGANASIVLLPYAFNLTSEQRCQSPGVLPDACPAELIYYESTEQSGEIAFGADCVESCFGECTARCFATHCVSTTDHPVNESAGCMPRCLARFLEESPALVDSARDESTSNVSACVLECEGGCRAAVEPRCSSECEHLLEPNEWQACRMGCMRNESLACVMECTLNCTGDHTAAYGFAEPYDPLEDLLELSDVFHTFNVGSLSPQDLDALLLSSLGLDNSSRVSPGTPRMDDAAAEGAERLGSAAMRESAWTEAIELCYSNCSSVCGSRCFDDAFAQCKYDLTRTQPALEMLLQAHDPNEGPPSEAEEATRRHLVVELNNCTLEAAGVCLGECTAECLAECEVVDDLVAPEELLRIEEAELLERYVGECESSCRLSIYGRNLTNEEICLDYYPGFVTDCIADCTDRARREICADFTDAFDMSVRCNATCAAYAATEEAIFNADLEAEFQADLDGANATNGTVAGGTAEGGTAEGGTAEGGTAEGGTAEGGTAGGTAENSSATGLPLAAPPPPPLRIFDYGAAFEKCRLNCTDSYENGVVDGIAYVCDGGEGRARGLAMLANVTAAANADGGVDPREQVLIDETLAAVPEGTLCVEPNYRCLYYEGLACKDKCTEEADKFSGICFREGGAQTNASFDYNVSSCVTPEGWKVGEPRWIWLQQNDPTHPEALEPFHPADARVWAYSDIVNNLAILNCSCHFFNETWDPAFVDAISEYGMRPFRDHYVSTCICLFNATSSEPQDCVHTPSRHDDAFNWTFADPAYGPIDPVEITRNEWRECVSASVGPCFKECTPSFYETISASDGTVTSLDIRFDVFGVATDPSKGYNAFGQAVEGFWTANHTCVTSCLRRSAEECADACASSCDENERAIGFGCTYQALPAEGLPQCTRFCRCNAACVDPCVSEVSVTTGLPLGDAVAAADALEVATCVHGCSAGCVEDHRAHCENVSSLLEVTASTPLEENVTATCFDKLLPTCNVHCLGTGPVNDSSAWLFSNDSLSAALLSLDLELLGGGGGGGGADTQEFACQLEECPVGGGLGCEAIKIGENVSVTNGTEVSVEDLLRYVTSDSLASCETNRSEACLRECHAVGHAICVPPTEPFDLCVASCISNKTYVEPTPVYDHSLMLCKKQLRLTPSVPSRSGAAWHLAKQRVREGFSTSFEFRIDHWSQRCVGFDHPDHENRPEHQSLCRYRGGDGFAFVIQDSGHTNLDPECAHSCLSGCVETAASACTTECRAPCPQSEQAHFDRCVGLCAAGNTSEVPSEVIAALPPSLAALAQQLEGAAAAAAAAAECSADLRSCGAQCAGAPLADAHGLLDAGCVRECLDARARAHCDVRCPLVDQDFDFDCLEECMGRWMDETGSCLGGGDGLGLNGTEGGGGGRGGVEGLLDGILDGTLGGGCIPSCVAQSALVHAGCEARCDDLETVLPSGLSLGYCLLPATAHPTHESSLCLTGCAHDDSECLEHCASSPPDAAVNCVAACPRDDTLCAAHCLEQREHLARECITPCVEGCGHSSSALGDGDSAKGAGNLANTLAVTFDTWYNSDESDPYLNHVAVHASGRTEQLTETDARTALGVSVNIPDLADGRSHVASISYSPPSLTQSTLEPGRVRLAELSAALRPELSGGEGGGESPGVIRVHVDGRMVLQLPLVLEEALELDEGRAYVGFTAATGEAYQEHLVTQWQWQSESGTANGN